MTPEERIAEKLRRQKLVEEADFELAKETFGKPSVSYAFCTILLLSFHVGVSGGAPRLGSIDDANPSTKEEFTEFKNNLVKKIQSLSTKTCYNEFIEDFVKDICIGRKLN